MKKILIKNFPNLNNYGTGMMGIITLEYLTKKFGLNNIEVYCTFNKYAEINKINDELTTAIKLKKYININEDIISKIKSPFFQKIALIINLIFSKVENDFDLIIVLGGDDFSEYYSKYIASIEIFKLWKFSKKSKVVMLGQTIGPFSNFVNKFFFKYCLSSINVYARDPWTVKYIQDQFGIKIKQMGDLAFNSLPLQGDFKIENDILKLFNLIKNNYCTVVVSGLVEEGYYCQDENIYLLRHREIISNLLQNTTFKNKKVVLLSHTFPPFGNESDLIRKLYDMFTLEERVNIVLITEKIYPTNARFILGNGLFTITGRMHPAVSTFQMGKPAISLSYSTKYKGVLGLSLNRNDLIIDANEPNKWLSGEIVTLVDEKIFYLLDQYDKLTLEIKPKIIELVELNDFVLNEAFSNSNEFVNK